MTDRRPISKDAVVHLLASALGYEKSDEAVLVAATELGIQGTVWTGPEVRSIVDHLGNAEGLVGIVARFVQSRGDIDRLLLRDGTSSLPPPAEAPVSSARRPSVIPSRPSSIPAAPRRPVDLVALLAPALGAEKSREATEAAAARHGLGARIMSREEAMLILDDLAQTEDIVGVVARFAKARLLLDRGS